MDAPTETTVAIYAAAFALFSAIAGVFAAIGAMRSARSDKASIEANSEEEKRKLVLELAKLAQEILSKAKSLNRLCDEVVMQYQSLAIFTGNVGGSRPKLYKDRVEDNRSTIASLV